MVQFENLDNRESFKVSIYGNSSEYVETIKTLLSVISIESDINQTERYYLCNLIECLLPDPEQIISIDDAKELQRIKNQNNNAVSDFVK